VPQHRRAAGHDACPLPDDERADQRRDETLRRVEDDDREPESPPEDAPDVRPADVAAAVTPDVRPPDRRDQPIAGGYRAGEIAGDGDKDGGYFWIWYPDTQSLTVDQSRLSKNASM
jgi:hypothetical protein